MIVGIPTETSRGERRVAIVPASVSPLIEAGLDVVVEAAAGESAGFPDTAYADKGARIATDHASVFKDADIVLQVRMAAAAGEAGVVDLNLVRRQQVIVGLSEPLIGAQSAKALAERGVTAFSMELIPRITRAQSMDALSSMATIAGYKAVLIAAAKLPRMFPMLMTAGRHPDPGPGLCRRCRCRGPAGYRHRAANRRQSRSV